MKSLYTAIGAVSLGFALTIFMIKSTEVPAIASVTANPAENPLTAKWTGPHGGLPPFDKVKLADFKPALEMAMAENLAEIDKIASDPAKPTFENTIMALERSGQMLERVSTIYGIWATNMSSDEFQPAIRSLKTPHCSSGSRQSIKPNRKSVRCAAKGIGWYGSITRTSSGRERNSRRPIRHGSPRSIKSSRACSPDSAKTFWAMRANSALC